MAGRTAGSPYPLRRGANPADCIPWQEGEKNGRLYILARKGKKRQIVCPDGEKSGAMYLSIQCATYLHLPELGFSLLKSEIYNLPIQSEAFLPRPRQAYNLPIFSHALADIQSARFAPSSHGHTVRHVHQARPIRQPHRFATAESLAAAFSHLSVASSDSRTICVRFMTQVFSFLPVSCAATRQMAALSSHEYRGVT